MMNHRTFADPSDHSFSGRWSREDIKRYYMLAAQVIYYYDYLLTLPDEIKYAWSGRKTWIFTLFFLNRYTPALYQTWMFFVGFSPQFTHHMCDKTSFLHLLSFFMCTIFAQVTLILRLYLLTFKNKQIVAFFSAITLSQALMGMYIIVIAARKPAQFIPEIPLQAFRMCAFVRSPRLELVYMTLSLSFDATMFLVIVFTSIKTGISLPDGQPSIFRAIVKDSTVYFLVIFSSHLLSFIMLLATRPTLQLLPSVGNLVLLPLMISRLMLSLKKASKHKDSGWKSEALSGGQMEFATRSINAEVDVVTTSDEVEPSDLSHGQAREKGDEEEV